jgi:hypothetical protein
MFERLTSPDNLAACRDSGVPILDRVHIGAQWLGVHPQLFDLYYGAFEKGQVRDSEMVEIYGLGMRNAVLVFDLWEELESTLDPNDEAYVADKKFVEDSLWINKELIEGGLRALKEQNLYRKDELLRLVEHMDETFPATIVRVPKSSRAELMQTLADYQTKPSLKKFQPALGQLLQNTRAALAAGSQWKKFTAPEFGVSADMPRRVEKEKLDHKMTRYVAHVDNETFAISVQTIKGDTSDQPERVLAIIRDIYIEQKNGRLISSSSSEFSGLPALRYEVIAQQSDGEESLMTIKTALGKKHVYMFIVGREKPFDESAQAKRFFESAEIEEP